jgi:hypothetical protein
MSIEYMGIIVGYKAYPNGTSRIIERKYGPGLAWLWRWPKSNSMPESRQLRASLSLDYPTCPVQVKVSKLSFNSGWIPNSLAWTAYWVSCQLKMRIFDFKILKIWRKKEGIFVELLKTTQNASSWERRKKK